MIRLLFAFLATLLLAAPASRAQLIEDPTSWTYEVKKTGEGKYDLIFKVALKPKWHIWSVEPGGDGLQIPTSFSFDANPAMKKKGGVKEGSAGKHSGPMDGVDGIVNYFEGGAQWVQSVTVKNNTKITGSHKYQVCDDKMCLPPKTKKFTFTISDAGDGGDTTSAVMPVRSETK